MVERDYNNHWEEVESIDSLLDGIRAGKDVLVTKLDEYNFYKNEFGSVYKDIEEKGVMLWSS